MCCCACRETLTNTETYKEGERKKQDILDAVVRAPKPEPPPGSSVEGPCRMEDGGDDDALPECVCILVDR